MKEDTLYRDIAVFEDGAWSTGKQALIVEEPLSIRIDGNPYSVVMRTPGDEIAHVAGFCLAEGVVETPGDFATIGFCDEEGTNVATVTLTENRRKKVAGILERKGFVSQTSCGICGKEVINDLQQILSPLPLRTRFAIEKISACVDTLQDYQAIYKKTHASHASVIFDSKLSAIAHAEDVGRHNALDKAIGKAFMANSMDKAVFALMSSRLSYELVQKAARAGIELIVGVSRPTALAVELADSIRMTLGWARGGKITVFCHKERLMAG
jgi:FdhD protein